MLSTVTSTVMTVLLLASIGQGFTSVALLAAAGLGFELLKWNAWRDAWHSHYSHQHDRRNILAVLCALAVVLSIGASIATTRSSLAVSAGDYLDATRKESLLVDMIRQKQEAIDVCTEANRITLCAMPLQKEVSALQQQLDSLEIPAPDEATALITEVGNITGLSFSDSATAVVTVISIMLDATGLYFLFLLLPAQEATSTKQTDDRSIVYREPEQPCTDVHTHVYGDVNLSVTLGIDATLRQAMELIQSGEVKPSVRQLSESMQLPQHTAQTILYWLAEAGQLERQPNGRGYALPAV